MSRAEMSRSYNSLYVCTLWLFLINVFFIIGPSFEEIPCPIISAFSHTSIWASTTLGHSSIQ